jgi:hypothetical protein
MHPTKWARARPIPSHEVPGWRFNDFFEKKKACSSKILVVIISIIFLLVKVDPKKRLKKLKIKLLLEGFNLQKCRFFFAKFEYLVFNV